MRVRRESRDHRADRQPSLEMRAQTRNTPRKQTGKRVLGATETFARGRTGP